MPCAINANYNLDCIESVGGIRAIWVTDYANFLSAGIASVTGTVTAFGESDYSWSFIDLPMGVANAVSTVNVSQENGTLFYNMEVNFPINKRNAEIRNLVNVLAKNRCVFITLENDKVFRMYGAANGLFMAQTPGGTGTAFADRNGYELKFAGMSKEDFLVVPYGVGDMETDLPNSTELYNQM